MESAAQNSGAVENPKRNVPLACMLGTLGAAAIYILSTAVIQGIVPNAELAKSTGPFAPGLRPDVRPDRRVHRHGLAVMACLGSLLGGNSRSRRPEERRPTTRCSPPSSGR